MNPAIQEQLLWQEDNLSLSSILHEQSIKVILKLTKNQSNKNESDHEHEYDYEQYYSGQMQSIQKDQKLSLIFIDDNQLIDHMKNKENIQIDLQKMIIKITMMVTTTKLMKIQICEILLQPIKINREQKLMKIMSGKQLSINSMNRNMKFMAECLYQLFNENKKRKQENQIFKLFQEDRQDTRNTSTTITNTNSTSATNTNSNSIMNQANINNNSITIQQFNQLKNQIYSTLTQISTKFQRNIKQTEDKFQQSIDISTLKTLYKYEKVDNKLNQVENSCNELHNKIIGEVLKMEQLSAKFISGDQVVNIEKKLKEMEKYMYEIKQGKNLIQIRVNNQSDSWIDINKDIISQNFIKQGKTITAKNPGKIMLRKILQNKQSFKIKMQKIMNWNCIGIMDLRYKNNDKYGQNYIMYSNTGLSYDEGGRYISGEGYKDGQTIKVIIDRDLGKLTWKINQFKIHQITSELIKDKSIDWVPYMFLANEGDKIVIIN